MSKLLNITNLERFYTNLKSYLSTLLSNKLDSTTEDGDLTITDTTGNIVLKVDNDGLSVTDVKVGKNLDSVTSHVNNADIHVTKEEKEIWNTRIFIGTQEEYEAAYKEGKILAGTIVIIEENTATGGATTAKLGVAVLGQMILGKE